jgi:osmotically-inducible protein OsmY
MPQALRFGERQRARAGRRRRDEKGGADKQDERDCRSDREERRREVVATTGEAITDGWITTKVKTKFDELIKARDIHVETNDQLVIEGDGGVERGQGASGGGRRGGTEGVTRVVNQLVVKGT